MKTPSNYLKAIFALSVIALIVFSCTKEELLPVTPANQKIAVDTHEAASPLLDKTLSEALASLEFAENPYWRVSIKSFICSRLGETLVVHNPSEPDLRFYDSRRFKIYWYKDGQPVRSRSIQLDCVCKGKYAAIVLHTTTQKAIGIAYYNARACFAIQHVVNSDDF